MGDALSGRHPVHVAGGDALLGAQAVAVQDGAVKQVGDGGQADVRMRAHIQAAPSQELARPYLVEEDERTDHLPLLRR